MWNLNALSLDQFIPDIHISHILPAVPHRFYSSASSTLVAAAVGGTYGLIGRVVYPNAGIVPLHYALWFVLAFQIKQIVFVSENKFEEFLGVGAYLDKLEHIPEDDLDLDDLIRYHCWRVIQLKNAIVKSVDDLFCTVFDIRSYEEINKDNVEEASFLEMCRYRVWPIFKATLLDTVSFEIAHHLSNKMGFAIPDRTQVSRLLIIRSIVKDIILVPALYVYARWCNQMADDLENSDARSSAYRAQWIRCFLPSL
jgi:hypothetical protein